MSIQSNPVKITVYVPARISSTRLARKALRDFGGKPLIIHVLDTLSKSMMVGDFVVNTESSEISEVVRDYGFKVFDRNECLAKDNTTTEEILADFARGIEGDIVAAINPTSPLISSHTIDSFFEQMILEKNDTQFSVSSLNKHCLIDGVPVNYSPFGPHPRTQDVRKICFLNWAVVAWNLSLVKSRINQKGDSIYLGKVGFYETPQSESVDIDTLEDFLVAETIRSIYLAGKS